MSPKLMFGYFPLQVCVLALIFVFWCLGWCMVLVNVLDYKEYKIGFVLVMLSVLFIVITWGMVFFGIVKKLYQLIVVSMMLWAIFAIFWFILVIVAVCVGPTSEIFVRHRGPESMWTMHNAYYRSQFDVDTDYYYYDHPASGRRQMYRLSSDGNDDGEQQPEPAVARPLHSGPVGLFDSRCIKWMLTIVCFAMFAYLIFGAWYVLFCYYKEISYERRCRCPAVCNKHETCCTDKTSAQQLHQVARRNHDSTLYK